MLLNPKTGVIRGVNLAAYFEKNRSIYKSPVSSHCISVCVGVKPSTIVTTKYLSAPARDVLFAALVWRRPAPWHDVSTVCQRGSP